jgi:uncharacterized OB-fold protein
VFEAVLWPVVLPHAQEFLDRARSGQLVLPRCAACGWVEPPGSEVCSRCLSEHLQWRSATGFGHVHSYVVFQRTFHPAFPAPYTVCVVELDEGPRIVGGMDRGTTELAIGVRVRAAFEACDAVPHLVFRSAARPSGVVAKTEEEVPSC